MDLKRGNNILQNSFNTCKDQSICKQNVEKGVLKFDNMAYEEFNSKPVSHTGRYAETIVWRLRKKSIKCPNTLSLVNFVQWMCIPRYKQF